MKPLYLYSIFHLNLAYSSIPEEKRAEVIRRCFWPLLDLARRDQIPIAIEAPAYTLEVTAKLDPDWLAALRSAMGERRVEFIGSGYTQLIGPLVPATVNQWNLEIGQKIYQELLQTRPALWYLNEQAYSAGLLEHFTAIKAAAVIMEWNNPRTFHPDWPEEYRYHPQLAQDSQGHRVPLIWNDSINFQKFQRCVHGDMPLSDFQDYLSHHLGRSSRYFCLYGSDAEIFNFRPGRFATESALQNNEWERIQQLYQVLQNEKSFSLVLPSQVLDDRDPAAWQPLHLQSPEQPIPVKKQPKYNLTRWAVTGRNSLYLNTLCHQLYAQLHCLQREGSGNQELMESYRKKLCYFWSSDFRTHITLARWEAVLEQLQDTLATLIASLRHLPNQDSHQSPWLNHLNDRPGIQSTVSKPQPIEVGNLWGTIHQPCLLAPDLGSMASVGQKAGNQHWLQVTTDSINVVWNLRKGLALQALSFSHGDDLPCIGTIPHGYFTDMALSADWYTANVVLQRPGQNQLTDLFPVTPKWQQGQSDHGPWLSCQGQIQTEFGTIHKKFIIYKQLSQLDVELTFAWEKIPRGAFRVSGMTLLPEAFDSNSLFYATHNGGQRWEIYPLTGRRVTHDSPASSLVSASHGLGATKGLVIFGDKQRGVALQWDQTCCAALPMIRFEQTLPSFFARLYLSLGEIDESVVGQPPGPLYVKYRLASLKGGN